MKTVLVLFMVMAASQAGAAENVVVWGRLLSNAPMEYVKFECPENHFCLHSWWKSNLNVEKTIHGMQLSGPITTANLQHSPLNSHFEASARLFVLEPIEDPEQRAKLRADYYLKDMAEPRQMFCLWQDPTESGLKVRETYVAGTGDSRKYCFELPKDLK
jgi:hypothetical protein